ncbi:Putative uncharacterized protein ART2 [Eumeta japonica]|uniref:Uncharacterized protein n=1 Tax=Eumeta variegata TaxID=151549 RepID=A0A4C1U5Z4_EUMVA|nr:Putative uncharacterized protein ART2 [Eumeta japonica]
MHTEHQDQASFCPFALREVSVLTELPLRYLRYYLTDEPPQSNSLAVSSNRITFPVLNSGPGAILYPIDPSYALDLIPVPHSMSTSLSFSISASVLNLFLLISLFLLLFVTIPVYMKPDQILRGVNLSPAKSQEQLEATTESHQGLELTV